MSGHFRFGPFVLDADTRLLLRDGAEVHVEPRVFDVIHYLIEERHRVVSKDELVDRVWHGLVISDAAISSSIRSARRALSDDSRCPAYIRTHHRRGFRFVAWVSDSGSRGAAA